MRLLESLVTDLRSAARAAAKKPGFTAIAIATLAVGVGATSALFSAVDAVLLRPLPFADPGRLVAVGTTPSSGEREISKLHIPTLSTTATRHRRSLRSWPIARRARRSRPRKGPSVSQEPGCPAGSSRHWEFPCRTGGPGAAATIGWVARRLRSWATSCGPGGSRATPASWARAVDLEWRVVYGHRSRAARLQLSLRDREGPGLHAHQPRRQGEPRGAGHALPRYRRPAAPRRHRWSGLSADLKRGRRTARETVPRYQHQAVGYAIPLEQQVVGSTSRRGLWILMGAVVCVLLVACANVANLMLARATEREREVAIRGALGADRKRLARQLLTESIFLGLAGGVAGLLVAWAGTQTLIALAPADMPRIGDDPPRLPCRALHVHRFRAHGSSVRERPFAARFPGRHREGAYRIGTRCGGHGRSPASTTAQCPHRHRSRPLAGAARRCGPPPAQPRQGAKSAPRLRPFSRHHRADQPQRASLRQTRSDSRLPPEVGRTAGQHSRRGVGGHRQPAAVHELRVGHGHSRRRPPGAGTRRSPRRLVPRGVALRISRR